MKRALVVLAILGVIATPVGAQTPNERTLRFEGSGTVVTLGDPFAGDFSLIALWEGKGPLGKIAVQSFYLYQQVDMGDGKLVCGGGQIGIRFQSTGDMLLLNVNPGLTGSIVPVPPAGFTWEQTWTGTVVGGTGRFQGATGTFTKQATGLSTLPGFVHIWEGSVEVALGPK
jgi:hypothetical protein